MASLTHQNLPLALYLEYSDLGFPVWSGGASGRQSNTDIINALGLVLCGLMRSQTRPVSMRRMFSTG